MTILQLTFELTVELSRQLRYEIFRIQTISLTSAKGKVFLTEDPNTHLEMTMRSLVHGVPNTDPNLHFGTGMKRPRKGFVR